MRANPGLHTASENTDGWIVIRFVIWPTDRHIWSLDDSVTVCILYRYKTLEITCENGAYV